MAVALIMVVFVVIHVPMGVLVIVVVMGLPYQQNAPRTTQPVARKNQKVQSQNKQKILKHLGLWHVKTRPPPRSHSPPAELYADYSDSQIPPWDDDYSDPDYPFEAYM